MLLDNNMLAVLAEAFTTITLGPIIVRVNYPGAFIQSPNVRGAIFLGSNCPGGNNPGCSHPGGNCLGGNFPRRQLSRGQFSLGVIIIRGNCPQDNYPGIPGGGGNFPRGQFSGHHYLGCILKFFYKYNRYHLSIQ